MPPIAIIDGWKVYVYVYANDHGIPHIHLRHVGKSIPISIMDGQILNGILPSSLHKKVVIWLDHHREEAIQAWESIREGRLPNWIE